MATKNRKTPAAPATTTPAPQLQFVELGKIRALPQVRTEFYDDDLKELAASIKTQGILQPVLLRPDPDAIDTYIVIAGERRVRAAHIAGLAAVPALIGETDEAKAAEMQLVENIQREQLSLADTAAGVLAMYERHQKLAPIAELTGKSLPWVSKHLAAATKLNFHASGLLASGKTEDLDLILTVSQIEGLGGSKWYPRGAALVDRIEEGRAGRTEARELLAALKAELDQDKAAARAAARAAKKAGATKTTRQEVWTPDDAMSDLHDGLMAKEGFDLDALMALWTADQAKEMCDLVRKSWEAGVLAAETSKLDALRMLGRHINSGYWNNDAEQLAAYTLGAAQIELTLRDLAIEWKEIVNP